LCGSGGAVGRGAADGFYEVGRGYLWRAPSAGESGRDLQGGGGWGRGGGLGAVGLALREGGRGLWVSLVAGR